MAYFALRRFAERLVESLGSERAGDAEGSQERQLFPRIRTFSVAQSLSSIDFNFIQKNKLTLKIF